MASTNPALKHVVGPANDFDIEDPPSGVRLIDPSRRHDLEPEPCSTCGAEWGTRRLPAAGGPAYCYDCVPEAPLDGFESLYVDLGGRG